MWKLLLYNIMLKAKKPYYSVDMRFSLFQVPTSVCIQSTETNYECILFYLNKI